MEFSTLLNERRSVRKYQPAEITQEQIGELVTAALLAPSWKNTQTGRYYAVCSSEKIDEFRNTALVSGNPAKCENVSCLIVSTFVKNIAGFSRTGEPDNEPGNEWGAYDLGLQAENLCLRAREMGFDTLIMGLRDEEAVRKFCDIPETEEVMAVIAVGKRDEEPQMPPRKPLERVLKFI